MIYKYYTSYLYNELLYKYLYNEYLKKNNDF